MMESLQQDNKVESLIRAGKKVFTPTPLTARTFSRKLQIRDAISWSICFAVVALLTGGLLLYRIGVTMSGVTSLLFYFSLAGLLFFVFRAVLLSGSGESGKQDGDGASLN